MPRKASRITLEIVSVRVERVQDISEEDAKAEGVDSGIWHREAGVLEGETEPDDVVSFRDGFGFCFECVYGPGFWEKNPWVWVVEFRRVLKGNRLISDAVERFPAGEGDAVKAMQGREHE